MQLPRGVKPGIFLVSAAMLLLEVVLTRIFSVVLWYHFAFVAVSLVLAGIAASGLAVRVLIARQAKGDFYLHAAIGFQLSTIAAIVIALAVGKVIDHPVILVAAFLAATPPFFCAGLTIGLALAQWPERTASIYTADLVGAA